jgi:hypothetical protein
MNLWDSVHRGLEKASHEAARMARTQRLRANIDGLMRHINAQQTQLIGKTMELYTNGQLTQSELLPICQTLTEMQQQMQQMQNELKQIQASLPPQQGQAQPQGQGSATLLYPTSGETPATGPYPPSADYQSYADVGPITAPPPPPPPMGTEGFAASEMETVMAPPPPPPDMASMQAPAPASMGMDAPRYCPVCQARLNPSYAFCHNCGTLVQANVSPSMPTMRASTDATFAAEGQETMRASGNTPPSAAPSAEENKGV